MSDKVYRNGETYCAAAMSEGAGMIRFAEEGKIVLLSNLLDEVWELGLALWPWRDAVRVSPDQAPMLAALGFGEPNE
jgi:hypothetical protein